MARSALISSTEYSVLSIFRSTHSNAFCTSCSSREVIVILLGVTTISLWNVSWRPFCCSINLRTRVSKTSMLNGLDIYESAPASYPIALLSSDARAVSRTTGICEVCRFVFIRWHSSIPSTFGIIMSLIISSGFCLIANFSPSSPSAASIIWYHSLSCSRRNSLNSLLSSTTNNRGFVSPDNTGSSSVFSSSVPADTCCIGEPAGYKSIGMAMVNIEPTPNVLSTDTRPSCSSTYSFIKWRPIPLPERLLFIFFLAW